MSLIKPSLERLLADVGPRRHRELHESLKNTLEKLQVDLDKIKRVEDLKEKKELTVSKERDEDNIEDVSVIEANEQDEVELDANDKKEDGEGTDDELREETNEEMSEENSEKHSQKTEETESTRPSTPARSRPSSAALARASMSSIYSSAYAGELPTLLLDAYWQPFKLALDNSMPVKIRVLALDLLQKMIAHKLLIGESPINSAIISTPPSSKRSSFASKVGNFSDVNNLTFLDASVSNDEGLTISPQELRQIDDVISSICSMYSGPSTDEQVQLQILKILLTLMTCETVEIHGLSLLKIVMTLINQYVFASEKMPVILNTARASLTQVVNIIIGRMEDRESPPSTPDENSGGERNTEDLDTSIQQSTIQLTPLRYDVYITFRLLCNLSIRLETQTTSSNSAQQKLTVAEELHQKGRSFALDLLLTMFSNSGPVFQRSPIFISLIKSHLCVSLSQNAVSANNTIFELSLSLFLMTLRYFRAPLKNELEVLFSEIYLKFLDMSQTAPQQTQLILEALLKICCDPQTLVDVYVNYDCDIDMSSLYERIVNILSKAAQRKRPRESPGMFGSLVSGNDKSIEAANLQERRSKLMGLKGLVGIVESLVTWSSGAVAQKKDSKKEHTKDVGKQEIANTEMNGDNATTGVTSDGDVPENTDTLTRPQPSAFSNQTAKSKNPIILLKSPLAAITMQHDNISTSSVSSTASTHSNDHERFEEMASRKQVLLQTFRLFNEKPIKGVEALVTQGFITDGSPESIAAYLMNTPGLSKVAIGEYLGAGEEEQIKVMHYFVDRMDFTGLGFVAALRKFLKTFRLPGESQKISRIMEKFADRYCENNPDSFSGGADTAYTLSYSVIMLNVDQHSPKVKAPMTPPEFVRNNRGIDANLDLPEDFLVGIFDDIRREEIIMDEDVQAKTFEKEGNKRKAYLLELAQMQKRSQMLLTYEKPRSAIGYRTAGNIDFVKPMFQIACWPLVATLSLAFEEAEEVQPAGTTDWARVNEDAIEFALRGFAGAIQIAGMFKMDVERDAFVSSLAKLTGLNHVTEMKPKNVAAIRTLLNVANTSGDYLDASWLNVLKIISSMDRLQLIGNTPAEQEVNGVNGLDYQQMDPSPQTPAISKPSNKGANTPTAPRFNTTPRRGSLSGLMREFQSQDFLIAIDRIFTNSVQLSGPAIVHFFEALCAVSNDEVRSTNPRMFSLQRIIEIAYYNMGRIRFEWIPLWKILQPYFNAMGCNPNTTVSTFAIDSLRQLSMKFLDRDELTHFHTQSEFLKPFEHIIRNNTSPAIHDLIIQSLVQMIMARAYNIKSGWKSIFIVFGRTAQDEKLSLVEHTFGILHLVHQKYFDFIGTAFVDYINCVLEFAMNAADEKVVSNALKLLARCAKQLMNDREEIPSSEDSTDELKSPIFEKQYDEASLKKLKPIDEEQFFLRWFPVVSALSRITLLAESQDVRSRALDTLFDVLKSSGEGFEVEPWRKIFRSVLMPLFDDLNDPDFGRKDIVSSVWVQVLTQMINLYNLFFDKLGSQPEFIEKLLSLMLSMVGQLDQLGQMGIVCFYQLVLQNAAKFDESLWEVVTSALEKIFDVTTPIELFKVQEKMEADKAEAENVEKYPSLVNQDPSTPTNLPSPGLLLNSEGEMSSPRNPTSSKNHVIDFASVTSKCAVHLSAIICVRDLTIRDASYHSMPTTRRSSLPAHQAAIYTTLQEHPPRTFSVAVLSPSIRNRWIDCIYKSYTFAHNFNENPALRSYLLQEGYVEKLPNLFKQETVSITVHISLLFDCYRHFGDNDTTLVRSPLDESKQALDSFFSFLTQPQKHQCDILNWSSFPTQSQKQQRDFLSWSSIPTVVYHEVTITAWAQETDFDNPKVFKALKAQIPWFFKSAIRLVEVGNVEVRKVIREFLDRVADHIVIE